MPKKLQDAEQILTQSLPDKFLPFRKSFVALFRRAKFERGRFMITMPEAERAFVSACQKPGGEFSRSWRAENLKYINAAFQNLFDADLIHEPLRLTNYRRAKSALTVDTGLILTFPLSQFDDLRGRFLTLINQAEWVTYSRNEAFAQFVFACANFVGLTRPGITLDLACLSINDLHTIIMDGYLALSTAGAAYLIHCPAVVQLSAWVLYRLVCPATPDPVMLSQTLGRIIYGNNHGRDDLEEQFKSRLRHDLNTWLRSFCDGEAYRSPTMRKAIQMCCWEMHHRYGNVLTGWLHGYHVYNPIAPEQGEIFEEYQQPFQLPPAREQC